MTASDTNPSRIPAASVPPEPPKLPEIDTKGSLSHYFPDRAPKIDIHTHDGLDRLLNNILADAPIIVLDLGADLGSAADFSSHNVSESSVIPKTLPDESRHLQ
jgi:hypothetical protein